MVKSCKHFPGVILFVFAALASTVGAHAAMPPAFREGMMSVSAESDYFYTSSNYDGGGNTHDLLSGNSYKNLSNKIDGTYYVEDDWSFSGGLGFAYATSSNLSVLRSNSNLTDVHVKAQKLFSWSTYRFIPEGTVLYALNTVDENGDTVLTSEGVNTFKGGSWGVVDFLGLSAFGFLGVESRTGGRSTLLPWTAGLGWKNSRWSFSGELDGFKTIMDDQFVNNRDRRDRVTRQVDGWSQRYYSVNPSLIEARLEFSYKFANEFEISAGVTNTIYGENTANGQGGFLRFTLNAGGDYHSARDRTPHIRRANKKEDQDFTPVLEDEDEGASPESGDIKD